GDPAGGFFVAAESPDLLFRSKEVFDGATPSGNAVAALNLLELAARTGDAEWLTAARASLRAFATLVEPHTDAVRMLILAVRRYHELAEAGTAADHADEQAAQERSADPPGAHLLEDAAEAVVTPVFHLDPAAVDGWHAFRLLVTVNQGWHIQANPAAAEYLMPTTVRPDGAEIRNLRYPPGAAVSTTFSDEPLAVYGGTVEITGEIGALTPEARLHLTYQPCDNARCLPEVTVEVVVLPL